MFEWFKCDTAVLSNPRFVLWPPDQKFAWVAILFAIARDINDGVLRASAEEIAKFTSTPEQLIEETIERAVVEQWLIPTDTGYVLNIRSKNPGKKPSDDRDRIRDRVARFRAAKKEPKADVTPVTRYSNAPCNALQNALHEVKKAPKINDLKNVTPHREIEREKGVTSGGFLGFSARDLVARLRAGLSPRPTARERQETLVRFSEAFTQAGLSPSDWTSEVTKQLRLAFMPISRPKSVTKDAFERWTQQVISDIESARGSVLGGILPYAPERDILQEQVEIGYQDAFEQEAKKLGMSVAEYKQHLKQKSKGA